MAGTSPLHFDDLVRRLPRATVEVTGPALFVPGPAHPFVPQTSTVDQCRPGRDPMDSDVLLFTAPAAVGKSTFARALASSAHIPLLDLARVPVSTHSLRGILSAESGPSAADDLQRGQIAIVIDALDEGRILSGEKNFEEFLRTTFQFLLQSPVVPRSKGPKVLLFGRAEAVDFASIVLDLEAQELPTSRLTIDYFDEESATKLVLEYAKLSAGDDHVRGFEKPISHAVDAFFDAIATAIGIPPRDLWQDAQGRGFAGYAPVLAALGTMIAQTKNYVHLQNRLKATGPTDAWAVLEQVANEVLDREAGKVQAPLAKAVGQDAPQEAYDSTDQLILLTAHLTGQPFRISTRLTFGSAAASGTYREMVKVHLQDHPFLRGGVPVNDVLGSLILANAIGQGTELTGGYGPRLLATYGRQPFLWRFLRHRLPSDPLISGEVVPFLLGSVWSDVRVSGTTVAITVGDTPPAPRLRMVTPDETIEVGLVTPLVLRHEVRDVTVDLPGEEIILRGWPGTDTSSIRFLGKTSLRARVITFEVERVSFGVLNAPGSCHLGAEQAVNDQRLVLELKDKSVLTIEGVFEGRYPWEGVAKPLPPKAGAGPLSNLLLECEQRLPEGVAVVVLRDYSLGDDPRMEWARKYGDLLPRLLKGLVDQGLARTDLMQASGDPKMRVRPDVQWSLLARAHEDPKRGGDERVGYLFRELG